MDLERATFFWQFINDIDRWNVQLLAVPDKYWLEENWF